jgi:hypothetical protein
MDDFYDISAYEIAIRLHMIFYEKPKNKDWNLTLILNFDHKLLIAARAPAVMERIKEMSADSGCPGLQYWLSSASRID